MILWRKHHLRVLVIMGCVVFVSCTTGKKKRSRPEGKLKSESFKDEGRSASNVSKNMVVFTSSTDSQSKKLKYVANKIYGIPSKERSQETYFALMTIQRLQEKGLSKILETTKAMMIEQIKKDANKDVPFPARLEIALAAISNKKLSMAEYYLSDLLDSKNRQWKAAALTAMGLIHLSDGKLPEALAAWESAVKVDSGFAAARFNLGIYAAKYADFTTAVKTLPTSSLAPLVSSYRHSGYGSEASRICSNPQSSPVKLNCGLFLAQNKNDIDGGIKLLDQVSKGRSSRYREHAFKQIQTLKDRRVEQARLERKSGERKKTSTNNSQKPAKQDSQKKAPLKK